MEESNPDLETFRRQWKEEVKARSKGQDSKATTSKAVPAQNPKPPRRQSVVSRPTVQVAPQDGSEEEDETAISGEAQAPAPLRSDDIEGYTSKSSRREPRSALEHYEKAVEREAEGSLGESLILYRKAFKVRLQSHHF